MQMFGRASRKEEEQANVDVFLSSSTYHRHLTTLTLRQESCDLERHSLTCLYNALQPAHCIWQSLLAYFNEHKDDGWTCREKCVFCTGEEGEQNRILEHPSLNTILKTINSVPKITKTLLHYLLLSTPSTMEKVPVEVQNTFFSCKDMNFKKETKVQATSKIVEDMAKAGLIQLTIAKNERAANLCLTDKGLSMIKNEVPSYNRTVAHNYDCNLPTQESIQACPSPHSDFSMPKEEDLKTIHEAEEMTDDLFELCLRIPVIKGYVVLDIKEENRPNICIPKSIVNEVFCSEHKNFKHGYITALDAFHKYPTYISWTVYTRWKSTRTFHDTTKGFNIRWYCAHRPFGCPAEKRWTSIGTEEHSGEEHVIFEEIFYSLGTDKEVELSRHIHACGAKVQNREKKELSFERCCVFDHNVVPECFKLQKQEEFPRKTISQPAFTFMGQLLGDFSRDPTKAQMISSVTYGKARNMQHSIATSSRPWLQEVKHVSAMSGFDRVQRLREYLEKQEGRQRHERCPTYIASMTLHETNVFTVICTDLFGVTLFTLATRRPDSVISVDGTGGIFA